MRIGVNCFGFNNKMGGLQQYIHRLFRELLLNDHINEYVFFYSVDGVEALDLIGVSRWREGALQVRNQWEILSLLGDIDLYFCPMGVLLPRPLPIASVIQLADIQEVYYPEFFTSDVVSWRKTHYANSTRLADAVVTLSEYSKQSIIKHHYLNPEKIFVSHLAADEFTSTARSFESILQYDIPERFVFYPANQWKHKNHDSLLKALLILKDRFGLSVPLVLTGHDVENGFPLSEKIAEYGLSGEVHLLGFLSEEAIQVLYRKATLLCFPSLFEGFGMPVLEAMLSGCPITCSDATSLPEICCDSAIYFNPNDPAQIALQIRALWENETLRNQLICSGKETAKKFSAANMAAVHLNAFRYAYDSFGDDSREMYRKIFYRNQNLTQLSVQEYANMVVSMQTSLSWRLTAPLRWITAAIGHKKSR